MEGSVVCRPWMMAWRADHSVSGWAEPEVLEQLMELEMSEGCLGDNNLLHMHVHNFSKFIQSKLPLPRMRTNPDLPGVERVSTTSVPNTFLESKVVDLPSLVPGSCLAR